MATFSWGTPTQIKNMLDPVSSGDGATKNYVDGKIAGSNTQIQFNNAGNFGASANLSFNSATNILTVIGNLAVLNANLGNAAIANFFIGSGNNLSNIQGSNVSGEVGFAAVANSVNAANISGQVSSALVSGTVTTAAQPNITSVGTLTSLSVSGNLISNNIESNGNLKANTLTVQNTVINGNLTVNGTTVYADVATLNVKDPVIEQGGNPNGVALSSNDGKDRGQLLHYYTSQPVDAFMGWKNSNSEFTFASEASLTTNNVTINKLGNIRAGNAVFSNLVVANYFTGTLITGYQPNITDVGTLGNLSVTGNIISSNLTVNNSLTISSISISNNLTVGNNVTVSNNLTVNNNVTIGDSTTDSMNVNARANFFGGVIAVVTNDNDGIFVKNSSNLNSGTLSAKFIDGTLTATSQPNITQVGTLSYLTVAGATTLANVGASGNITATGNVTGGNLVTSGRISATNTITGGNLVTTGVLSVTGSASAGNLSSAGTLAVIGNSNVGNLGTSGLITATGNVTGGNLNTGGALSVTGNANVGNIGAGRGVFTSAITGATTLSITGNANVGNLGISGLTTATGNITAGNLNTTGVVSVTGNIVLGSLSVITPTNNQLTVNASIIPNANITYDLGSSTKRWNDLYLANSTIYLANASISATDTTVTLSNAISANGITSSGDLTVSGKTNLNSINNITISGGTSGALMSTDGSGNLSWVNPTEAAGTNTQVIFNDNGVYAGNAGFTFNKATGRLTTTLLTGTLTTVAQPNITSVGVLTSLGVTGNTTTGNIRSNGLANIAGTANVGNLSTVGVVEATGTITGGNLTTAGNATVTGNISGGNISTTGLITVTGNVSAGNFTTAGNVVVTSNISANNLTVTKNVTTGDLSSANISGSGFANIVGNIITAGHVFANSGNIQANNLSLSRNIVAGNITSNANVVTANLSASGNVSFTGSNVSLGSVSNLRITGGTSGYFLSTDGTGTLSWSTPDGAMGNNTEVQFNDAGVLAGSSVFTYNKNTGVLSATQFNGSGAGLTSIPAGNISGTVASATSATRAATVTASSQPNITSVGTLVDANVAGNIDVTGNLFVGQLTNLGNIGNVKITGGTNGYLLKTDGTGNLNWIAPPNTDPGGSTTEVQFNDGGVFGGNSSFTFNKTTGKLSATHLSGSGGNITSIPAANISGTIPADVTFAGTVANAVQANVANYAGIVTGNTQANITSVGTLKRLRVSNAGFNETDALGITGYRQSGYFSTTDTSFWIMSAANSVATTTGTMPPNPGSGFEILQDTNQVNIINAGYQTVTVNPHGDFKPKTSSAGGSLQNNLGGKAGGTEYVYDITGTPAGSIAYGPTDFYAVSQDSTSGSGTGALFEIYTVQAIGGIAYNVIVNDPGRGYVEGETITINGANLGGTTPANNLTFKVSQTWDAYWRNLYVGDININNGSGNLTLMAGSDGNLYLRNNSTGSKYRLSMVLVSSGTGPSPLN